PERLGTEKIKNVRSFCRQKEKEVIICGRAHLPNKDPPFSGIRLVLSILLDSVNGSGSPARGMFGYFTFIFISSTFAAAGGWAKLHKQGTQIAAALLDLSHIKIITATLLYYVFRSATGCRSPCLIDFLLFSYRDHRLTCPRKSARYQSPNICRLPVITFISESSIVIQFKRWLSQKLLKKLSDNLNIERK
ncbi:hypothetical protein K0M31_016210, partial [Melipona bicolor]